MREVLISFSLWLWSLLCNQKWSMHELLLKNSFKKKIVTIFSPILFTFWPNLKFIEFFSPRNHSVKTKNLLILCKYVAKVIIIVLYGVKWIKILRGKYGEKKVWSEGKERKVGREAWAIDSRNNSNGRTEPHQQQYMTHLFLFTNA